MKKTLFAGMTTLLVVFAFTSVSAQAKNCGNYRGSKLATHGVSCKTAKRVFKRYDTGRSLPAGWMCAASAGICERDQSHYFTFRLN